MSEPRPLHPASEEQARLVAGIIGPGSAHARALRELDRRREAGEEVYLYRSGPVVVVGPSLPNQERAA